MHALHRRHGGRVVDPENPEQTFSAIDMLDPEVVARLVEADGALPGLRRRTGGAQAGAHHPRGSVPQGSRA